MVKDRIPIGRFSLITRLTEKTLRYYDRRGILVPEGRDICTGYRSYTVTQIPRAIFICSLQMMGFPPDEISSLLEARDRGDDSSVRGILENHGRKVRSEIQRLQKIETFLQEYTATSELIAMTFAQPTIKEIEPLRVISKREKGVYAETIGRLINELCEFLAKAENEPAGVKVVGPVMSLYYDMEYKEADADIEVAIPISGKIPCEGPDFMVHTLEGGTFLSTLHKGPYMNLHVAWSRLYTFAEEKGYHLIAPGRELYLNDPWEVPEEEILTELQVMIEKKDPDQPR